MLLSFGRMLSEARGLLDLLLPPRCILCEVSLPSGKQPHICITCRSRIRPLQHPHCPRCLQKFESTKQRDHLCGRCLGDTYYDQLYAFGQYDEVLSELIQKLKFGKKLTVAPVLGTMLASYAQRMLVSHHYDCIVPVPTHRRSLAKRGFNQAHELAGYIEARLRVPRVSTGLSKPRLTPDQARLTLPRRQANLRGAFETRRSFHGESCLLVDDVYTTGATAENCAKTLKEAGALRVDVLALARTV